MQGSSFANYYELTKPNIWYLLVFTALGAAIAAGGLKNPIGVILVIVSTALGSAGANTLTCYIDRDIDAIMQRTKHRPIPSGRISPARALYFGLAISALSIALALLLNPLSALLMFLGITDNVVVYSMLLKRRNPMNIILGGFSGGAPALIGYAGITSQISLEAILVASLVMIWIPAHIWSLSLRFKDDYSKVKIPMMPVITSNSTAIRVISFSSILLVVFSLIPYVLEIFGLVYLVSAVVLGAGIIYLSIKLLFLPTEERAWTLFKFTSPYLAIIFVAMMADAVLRSSSL
ncbi:MAG: protoheme IX farnesyltransferase [Thaumarchaeota archaeon]|nr:protoheme IX farnesyltransferase [Nitrososphaerota archaeon]